MLWIDSTSRLGLGWRVYGFTDDQQDEARRLFKMIEAVPRRWDALSLAARWRLTV